MGQEIYAKKKGGCKEKEKIKHKKEETSLGSPYLSQNSKAVAMSW
jgi:hypothetical protein